MHFQGYVTGYVYSAANAEPKFLLLSCVLQEHLIKLNAKNDVAHSLLTTGEDMLQSYNCHPFQTVQIRSSLAKLRRSCDAAKKQAKKKKVSYCEN